MIGPTYLEVSLVALGLVIVGVTVAIFVSFIRGIGSPRPELPRPSGTCWPSPVGHDEPLDPTL